MALERSLIFIVGVGRSGTSLLQSMLHSHSEIEFLPETQFLRKYVLRNPKYQLSSQSEREGFIEILRHDDKFGRLKIDPPLVVSKSAESYLDIYKNILETVKKEGTQFLGDKDPRFLDFIPHLYKTLAHSKIIHIIRDPRDVVLSRTKADWSKHWPFFMHAYIYRAQIERGRDLARKMFGNNYMELYYEDLIEHPETELNKISSFLQIEFDAGMLQFGDSAKSLVDEKEMQWKKETLGPLLKNNKQKWRSEFTNEQINLVEEICSDTFRLHPYQKSKAPVSFFQKIKAKVLRIGATIFKWIYPLRIRFIK